MAIKPIEEDLEDCLSYMTEDNKSVYIRCTPFHLNKESYTVEELKQVYRKFYKGIRLISSINEIKEVLGID